MKHLRSIVLLAWLAPAASLVTAQELELYPVTRVIDGDTIYVERAGETEKLRLLSVDTEEKITGRPASSATKPETVFGQETTFWAQEFFADLAEPGEPARVGLRFPNGEEERDIYGRLLCHVILPDGRDFNLLLVKLGKSPYFNKYGNSRIDHEAFVRAQEAAQKAKIGVWDPATNRATTEGAPSAIRPYDRLLPWWQARAEAIGAFRTARADGEALLSAESPAELQDGLTLSKEKDVRVFGEVDRFFDEEDGSLTVLFRSGDRQNALRASLPAPRDAKLETFLRETTEEMRQNFLIVRGRIVRGPRGLRIVAGASEAWSLAGPEPTLPQR